MSDHEHQLIRKLPAARGLSWISGSWGLVKRQPIRLLLISLFFQLLMWFSQVGALGFIFFLFLPVLSAGLLHAFFLVERGERPMVAVLFMPFTEKGSLGPLLLLGAIAIVLVILVFSLMLAGLLSDIDPDILARLERRDFEALLLIDPNVIETAFLALALSAAIIGTITYFSIPLIWFRKHSMSSSIVSSLKALGRNWKPLLVNGLVLGILAVPILILAGTFYLSLPMEGVTSSLMDFFLTLLRAMIQLLVFGAQYLAFRDIFGLDEVAVKANKLDDQLVA